MTLQDEEWRADEIDLLVTYVEEGGLLVLTNSARRLFFGQFSDANEDWEKVNALAAPFGISYEGVPFTISVALVASAHLLTGNLSGLRFIANNGLPISLQEIILPFYAIWPAMHVIDDVQLMGRGAATQLLQAPHRRALHRQAY